MKKKPAEQQQPLKLTPTETRLIQILRKKGICEHVENFLFYVSRGFQSAKDYVFAVDEMRYALTLAIETLLTEQGENEAKK